MPCVLRAIVGADFEKYVVALAGTLWTAGTLVTGVVCTASQARSCLQCCPTSTLPNSHCFWGSWCLTSAPIGAKCTGSCASSSGVVQLFTHACSSLVEGGDSHKSSVSNPLLKFYYSFPYALFFLCVFNEGGFVALYLLHAT